VGEIESSFLLTAIFPSTKALYPVSYSPTDQNKHTRDLFLKLFILIPGCVYPFIQKHIWNIDDGAQSTGMSGYSHLVTTVGTVTAHRLTSRFMERSDRNILCRYLMDGSLFIQGIIIGLTLAVPVGPISLLCIQRSIADGRLHGIISGIGVASSDSFYAAISFLGLTIISGLIIAQQYLFRFLAGIVLIFIGIRVFLSVPTSASVQTGHETYLKDYLSMAAIAIANPLTLLFFMVIVPGFGIVIHGNSLLSAVEFVAGVFFGSTVWWILLCGSVGTMRTRISEENLGLINRISGILISCFGAGMLLLVISTGSGG
jgi:threonine/homoserine/homoserine lactone efflux protein